MNGLYGCSATYRTPKGHMGYWFGVLRFPRTCCDMDLHDRTVEEISRDPKRRYAGKLNVEATRIGD